MLTFWPDKIRRHRRHEMRVWGSDDETLDPWAEWLKRLSADERCLANNARPILSKDFRAINDAMDKRRTLLEAVLSCDYSLPEIQQIVEILPPPLVTHHSLHLANATIELLLLDRLCAHTLKPPRPVVLDAALAHAVARNDVVRVEKLQAVGARVNCVDDCSTLHELVQVLDDTTELRAALRIVDPSIMDAWMLWIPDSDRGNGRFNPLDLLCRNWEWHPRADEVLRWLLAAGANPNGALKVACSTGNVQLLHDLLRMGADDFETAYLVALESSQCEILRVLAARQQIPQGAFGTALAVRCSLQTLETLVDLVPNSLNEPINQTRFPLGGSPCKTVLDIALHESNEKTIEWLIIRGARLSQYEGHSELGRTVVSNTVRREYCRILKLYFAADVTTVIEYYVAVCDHDWISQITTNISCTPFQMTSQPRKFLRVPR